jgi:hypothetical protein
VSKTMDWRVAVPLTGRGFENLIGERGDEGTFFRVSSTPDPPKHFDGFRTLNTVTS